jgi:L-alanine exporter
MRAFLADTLALLTFFTVTGALNERFVAGMSWSDVLTARAVGAPLMVLTARPYGLWRDWFVGRLARDTRRGRTLSDAAALMIFQVPLYALVIWIGGADGWQVARGCLGAAVLMLALGRPYGLWLDMLRSWFGLGPSMGEGRPMSLQG